MKRFFQLLLTYFPKYKSLISQNIIFNILAAFFSIFQIILLIPVLEMLLGTRQFISQKPAVEVSISNISAAKEYFYYYISELAKTYGSTKVLILVCGIVLFATLFKLSFTYLSNISIMKMRFGIIRDLRNQLFKKFISLPIGYFKKQKKGDILARMTQDIGNLQASLTSSLELLFKNPIIIISTLITMFYISWQLSLFIIIFLPIAGLIMGRIGKTLKKSAYNGQVYEGKVLSSVEEALSGLRIIKSYNAQERTFGFFRKITDETRKIFIHLDKRYLLAHPVSEFFGTIIMLVVCIYGGLLIINKTGNVNPAVFLAFLGFIYTLILPLKNISQMFYIIKKGLASIERIDEVLNEDNPIKNSDNPKEFKEFETEIEYRNVFFKYENDYVLNDVSLTIKKGQSVALVGQSGSGKSTFVDLLVRFYDVNGGGIYINGNNIKDYKVSDLRGHIGNVNQETILFNESFNNNIAFSVEHSTQEDIINAAKIANAHDFIMETEKGYESNVGDRGGKLSGGQRQRISIARAILSNPPIMILDEATSALDTESEKLVQDAIYNLMKNRTSIIVAHRLSTIKNCDMICVFKEGKIIERGTHDELIDLGGEYRKLHDLQSL